MADVGEVIVVASGIRQIDRVIERNLTLPRTRSEIAFLNFQYLRLEASRRGSADDD